MDNYLQAVKTPIPLKLKFSVDGLEDLSLAESFNLFFKEVGLTLDTFTAKFASAVHQVDTQRVARHIKDNNYLFVQNTTLPLLTPEHYIPGIGNMLHYTEAVVKGVIVVGTLKTEATRLYDWLKRIIKSGRLDGSYRWTITGFDQLVDECETFLKNLPDSKKSLNYNLGEVYVNFEDFFHTVDTFNMAAKTFKAREVEVLSRELAAVYDLGNLLITKIQANDITLPKEGLVDIENVVNRFVHTVNVAGALMVLLNELAVVLDKQVEALFKLK